jgi:hypothetical protein
VLLIAACSGSSSSAVALRAPTAPAKTLDLAPVAPEPREPPPFRLRADVAAALAVEPLHGVVLVGRKAALFATEESARAGGIAYTDPIAATSSSDPPYAMTVRSDRGDVVELSTAHASDCVGSWKRPFTLAVFVRRSDLVPRIADEVVEIFEDGSGYAVARGAPVEITERGLHWFAPFLDEVPVPEQHQLRYTLGASVTQPRLPEIGSAAPESHVIRARDAVIGGSRVWIHVNATPIDMYARGAQYLVDYNATCGVARVKVRAIEVEPGMRGGGRRSRDVDGWSPSPGPVTWPDGSPAGRYTGVRLPEEGPRYRRDQMDVSGPRVCVHVDGVVERVCHRRGDISPTIP